MASFFYPQGAEMSLQDGAEILRNFAIIRITARLTGIREFCNSTIFLPSLVSLFRGTIFPRHLSRLRGFPGNFPTRLSTFDHRAEGKRLAMATRKTSVGVSSPYPRQKVRNLIALFGISELLGRSHNPEVAGSSPASATKKSSFTLR